MSNNFVTLMAYVATLGLVIDSVDEAEEMVVVSNLDEGLNALVLDVEDDILIMEQSLFTITYNGTCYDCTPDVLIVANRELMDLNRELVHGAFATFTDSETGHITYIWRDTISLAGQFDVKELEASINALSLAMAEHGTTLIDLAA